MRQVLLVIILLLAGTAPLPAQNVQCWFGPKSATDPESIYYNLLLYLDSAKQSVRGSCHEIDSIPIANKLVALANKGVEVNIVVEKKWWDGQKAQAAREVFARSEATIVPVNIVLDSKDSGLMHNKFFVVDGRSVWTGSTNMTDTCLTYNFNSAVRIDHPLVARNFVVEFNEQLAGKFGKRDSGKPNTPNPVVRNGEGLIMTCFCPEDDPVKQVVTFLNAAKQKIDIMAFVFSSEEMAKALIKAHKRGVKVRVLLDNSFAPESATENWPYVPYKEMVKAGIECMYDDELAKLHHKTVIMDDRYVLVGSMNLSANGADSNDENFVIIDDPDIADKYTTEFKKLWKYFSPDSGLAAKGSVPAANQTIEAEIIHPLDGDTLLVQTAGVKQMFELHLIGVDAPAKANREVTGQEPWGTRAHQWLSYFTSRRPMKIEFDVKVPYPGANKYWGYVWLNDKLVNEELLRQGHAVLATDVPNIKYEERLRNAQREARENGVGIWNPDSPLPESPSQFVAQKVAEELAEEESVEALTLGDFRDGCVIGNSESKKYHVEGGQYYESTKDSRHAVFFANEAAARQAGFEKSSR